MTTDVLGVLSCLIWALVLVVAVKYVLLIMRADNQGEGGIFALLALALWGAPGKHLPWVLTMLGLAGAALGQFPPPGGMGPKVSAGPWEPQRPDFSMA